MNARQKAKFYKKKYEELANMPYPNVKVESVPVEELCFERLYPFELVESYMNDGGNEEKFYQDVVLHDAAYSMVPMLQHYIVHEVTPDPALGYRYRATLRVVRRDR